MKEMMVGSGWAPLRRDHARESQHARDHQHAPTPEHAAVRTHIFGPREHGGADRMEAWSREVLLEALGRCTADAITHHASQRGWELGEITVEMSQVADGDVMRIGRLVQVGTSLDDAQREELARVCDGTPLTRVVSEAARISTLVLGAPLVPERWFPEVESVEA